MSKVFLIIVVALVAYFIYSQNRDDVPPPSGTIALQAPLRERLDALVKTDPVDAAQLAALTAKSPAAANAALRNRALTITGTVYSFRLTGPQRDILKVTLEGDGITRVCLTFNPRKHNTTSTFVKPGSYYEIVGPDVLYFPERGVPGQVLFQKGGRITKKAFFDGLATSEIQFVAQ